MLTSITEFYTQATDIVTTVNIWATDHHLLSTIAADHICYKCESSNSFEHIRTLFESESTFIYQSIISGRRIAYIKIKNPINTVIGDIHYVELSDQKPDHSQKEGFDHIEVYPTTISYTDLIQQIQQTTPIIEVVRPHHTTHDVALGPDHVIRFCHEPLVQKIKRQEMM